MVDVFFTSTLCIALANADHERDTQPSLDSHGLPHTRPEATAPTVPDNSVLARLQRALRTALLNPLPWAIALGAATRGLEITLPAPLTKLVSMMADAASPVALFTIGTVLRRAQLAVQQDPREAAHREGRSWRRRLREGLGVGRLALFKLLLHPLLMLVLGLAARQLGAELSTLQLTALVLVAALPAASSVALWSERYQADTARVVHVIMVSTAMAFVSFTLIALALGLAPR
jgi:predicted permease